MLGLPWALFPPREHPLNRTMNRSRTRVPPGSSVRANSRRMKMNTLAIVDEKSLRSDVPDFRPGDTLNVHVKVIAGSKERSRVCRGVVRGRQGGGIRETFTVREGAFGVGVVRAFPVHSPNIDHIDVVTRGDVRRAKLYSLRDLRGKAAKIKEKRWALAPDGHN